MTSPRASEDSGAGEPGAGEPPGPDAEDPSSPRSDQVTSTSADGTPRHGPGERTPGEHSPGEHTLDEPGPDQRAEPRPTTGIRWSTGETPAHGTPSHAPTGPPDDDATPPSGLPPAQAAPGPWQRPGHPQRAPPTWQQTAPGWAPAPAPAPPDPARRRRIRRIVLAIVLGLVVVAAVVVALLAFLVGPRFARYDVLDRAAVERGVTDVVTRDWHRQITGVVCPDDERVRPGSAFVCTATVDGRPQQVPVDVVDENGTYEVGQPR